MDSPTPKAMQFLDLTIEYDERVLEPRTWTELQSRWAAELLASAPSGRVLELCSGAGHIGLGAAALSGRELLCVDIDPVACHFTALNAAGAGLEDRVVVRHAGLEVALNRDEQFVLAIADPPWVVSSDVEALPADPVLAIDGGPDGLAVAHACIRACRGHLSSGGSLLLQLGHDDQVDVVVAEARLAGWREGGRRSAPRSESSGGGVVVRLIHP